MMSMGKWKGHEKLGVFSVELHMGWIYQAGIPATYSAYDSHVRLLRSAPARQ